MILLFAPVFLFAQKKEKKKKDGDVKFDTAYIKSFRHDITLKCYGNFKSNSITQYDGSHKILDYKINNPFRIGFGVSYKWFNLLATLITPFPVNEYKKGKTDHFDIRLNMYGRRTVTDVWFQFYKGYYLANSNSIIPKWNNANAFYRRSDLDVASFGGVMYFNLNKRRFSYKASFSQTDRQIKSSGAPIMGVNWSGFHVTGDSALLPSALKADYTPEQRVQSITTFTLGLGGGYAYTYIFKKHWFASLSGTVFVVGQTYNYLIEGNPAPRTHPGLNFNFLSRGAAGYNNDKNYYGLVFISDNIPLGKRLGSTFHYSFGTMNLMYAHRFSLDKIRYDKNPG